MKSKFAFLLLTLASKAIFSQNMYFPPLLGSTWETTPPSALGWCTERIDSLYHFLDSSDTKGFIVLKDGKIVLEKYFDNFTLDSAWYWASAGKTVTSFMAGIAQQEGFLNINNKTSDYLGNGWTSEPIEKEDLIKVRNHLTLTTGIDFDVQDQNCIDQECLQYLQDAGEGWYYHNATYLLVQDIIASATGSSYQNYYNSKLGFATGMFGIWLDGVLYSKPRSMARFGSLILNHGIWDGEPIMSDTNYYNEMVNTSQDLNLAYGYLFWLNGKNSYHLPGFTFEFQGELIPDAPADMVMGLGKNDQKLYIIPSENMVVVRMGNIASPFTFALSDFDDKLWQKINALDCSSSSIFESRVSFSTNLYPNPAKNKLHINVSNLQYSFIIFNVVGEIVNVKFDESCNSFDLGDVPSGMYTIQCISKTSNHTMMKKFIKL